MNRSLLKPNILSEAKACLHLAIPLAAAQLAQAATNFFDTLMMGWLGTQTLAAGALGAVPFSTLLLIITGIISVVGALAAVAFGSGEIDRLSRLASQGLWLSIALSIPVMLLIWYFGPLLMLMGQEPTNVILAETYLRSIVWGFPAAVGFAVLKNIVSALNRPHSVMVITVSGVLLNVVGNYVLMFGKFGFPALGLAGIGWASTISFWVTFAAAAGFILINQKLRSYKIFRHLLHFDIKILGELIRLGWPIGVLFTVETGLFAVTALLMGYLGTVSLAAHQIALQTAAITFMVPVGISYATTMRVGQMVGRNDADGARLSGYVGIAIGAIFMSCTALLFWTIPDKIVAMYIDTNNPANLNVVKTAISLLGVAAMFQIFDGIQVIAAGALRGLKDTKVPMLIGFLSYWCVGLVSGYIMGIQLHWGGVGLWLGLVLGLAVASVILTWRFTVTSLQLKIRQL
ncbi:MAG TPA: MATE family efflux transporter [Kamptonema sp.]|nr:MATE family efflux transporter [Kamptonema sp.]